MLSFFMDWFSPYTDRGYAQDKCHYDAEHWLNSAGDCHLGTADWNYFRPISWVVSEGVGMGAIMRQIISSVLLVAMCIGSMASVIWVLNFGGFNLMLIAGGCIAAVSTVVLAEEFVEWRSRTKGKVSEASPVQRQLLPPAA
jgi:hypothetical protein